MQSTEDTRTESPRLVMPRSNIDYGMNAKEQRFQLIKDFIDLNDGKVITMDDFAEASKTAAAPRYVKDLLEYGIIVRTRAEGKGHNYTYKWVGEDAKAAIISTKSQVVTRAMMPAIENEAKDYIFKIEGDDEKTLEIKQQGVIEFIKMLKIKTNYRSVEEQK